jgi:hydrogenase maturation protease
LNASVAPVLVLAVGNPSRGDDALGPLLAERIEAAAFDGVEVLTDFQLQIEHALDLQDRELVVFIDAGFEMAAPFEWRTVNPSADFLHTTHALSPGAVLETFSRVTGSIPPPCLILCVRGESFALGEPLSAAGRSHLEGAWRSLRLLCGQRTAKLARGGRVG